MMSAANTLAVIEGVKIAKEHDIDLGIMQEVILNSSGSSNSLEKKFDKIINKDYEPNFKLSLMRKDVKVAIDSSDYSTLPLAQLVYDLLLQANDYDDMDFTSVSRLYF